MLTLLGPGPKTKLTEALEEVTSTIFPTDPVMRLFQTDIPINADTLMGDFVEADFSGYAAVTVTTGDWNPAVLMPDGTARQVHPLVMHFEQTAATVSNVVYGWYLTDALETEWLLAGKFDLPYSMNADDLTIDVELAAELVANAIRSRSDVESNAVTV